MQPALSAMHHERLYRHPINPGVRYTEGVFDFIERTDAWRVLDAIAIAQRTNRNMIREAFQAWQLRVREDHRAELSCTDASGELLHHERIAGMDSPCEQIMLCVKDGIVLLPNEA